MNEIYDRKTNKIYQEKIPRSLIFFYKTAIGRIFLRILIMKPITLLGSFYMNSCLSKFKIKKFIRKNHINMSEYDITNYKSFNEFFIRKIKKGMRSVDFCSDSFIAPADSKLSIYHIKSNAEFKIKNSIYTVSELIENNQDCNEFIDGFCLIFRLSVDDYHHYCFSDSGLIKKSYEIKGVYHTVNPISSNHDKVYHRNHRIVNILETKNFGEIIDIEVGALMVGKIINHDIKTFKKGQEKGYFCFGGSTIVLLIQKNQIELDDDITNFIDSGIEIRVKYGEKIGRKINKYEV